MKTENVRIPFVDQPVLMTTDFPLSQIPHVITVAGVPHVLRIEAGRTVAAPLKLVKTPN